MLLLLPPLLVNALAVFEKYIFNDWQALGFLTVVFLLDTALGMARSFRQGRFHSRGMRQMLVKLREYAVGIVIAHVFCNLEVDGSKLPWAYYMALGVKGIIYTFILLIETKSIDENLRGLGGRGLPMPAFLRKGMKDWEESGTFRSKMPPAEMTDTMNSTAITSTFNPDETS